MATPEKQRENLKNVFDYLKDEKGISQETVANTISNDDDMNNGIDSTIISKYKTGKIQCTPDNFLSKLEKHYNINPQYVRGESEIMINPLGTKFSAFEHIVNSWDTVERTCTDSNNNKEIKKYLHLTMDRNFYDFLIEVDKTKLIVEDGWSSQEAEMERAKKLFLGKPNLEEFVIIPRNVFWEIVKEDKENRKNLQEVINTAMHTDYLDE